MKAKIALGLGVVFLALQAFRPEKNLSAAAVFAGKDDITVLHPPSPEVRRILADSCYDCHSNRTSYPWYAEIQPVGWWLARHIADGKRELNFSEFGAYGQKRKMKKLEALCDEVRDHTMPLKSYTFIHRSARLTEEQVKVLCAWAEAAQDRIAEQ